MNILLTNDDGIEAAGIQALRETLSSLGNLTIVAPDRERSASGHGITLHKPLRVFDMGYNDSKGFAVTGTPADCVKLAIEGLMEEPPDVLISGINSGANLGTDVLYSGTVSAAIEGIISGIPSIAISLATEEKKADYRYASELACKIAREVFDKGLPEKTILNVNVPDIDTNLIQEIAITRMGVRKYTDCIEKRVDPRGYDYFWLGGKVVDVDCIHKHDICTDITAILQRKVSITPIHFDLTNYQIVEELKSWEFK